MLAKINFQLTDRDKKLLLVIAVLAVLAIGYFLISQWYLPEYNNLKVEIENLEQEVAQLTSAMETLEQLELELKDSLTELEQVGKIFDWQVLQGEPILFLKEETAVENIRFSALKHMGNIMHGYLHEVNYFIAARGAFADIFTYLEHLDSQEKALRIKEFKLVFPHSFSYHQQDEIILEIDLAAYGAADYQGLSKQDLSWFDGRHNIFEPAVYAPSLEELSEMAENEVGDDEQVPSLFPRYNLPTEEEVNGWKQP